MKESTQIAEALLRQTGDAIQSGEFDNFKDCFTLPQLVVTPLGQTEVTDTEGLRAIFDRVRWHYRGLGVTLMHREVLHSMFMDRNAILSVHMTQLFRHNSMVQKPHKALSKIIRRKGVWQITQCDYAIKDSLRHNRALFGPHKKQKGFVS